MAYSRRGLGASDPYAGTDALGGPTANGDCTPGTPGCVPHWYCYAPLLGIFSADCRASFAQGAGELAQAGSSVVGETAGKVAAGTVAGASSGFWDAFSSSADQGGAAPTQVPSWVVYVGVGIGALVLLNLVKGGLR